MPRFRFFAKVVSLGLIGVTIAIILTLACALGTAWWWSGTEGSLAQTLQSLAPQGWLNRLALQAGVPLGQLSTRDVTGSLRFGGKIGAVHWQQQPETRAGKLSLPGLLPDKLPGLSLDASDLLVQWDTPALLEGRVEIKQLAAQRLSITVPHSNEPTVPPQAVLLPLPVSVNFNVEQLEVKGATAVTLGDLQGSYIYDSGTGNMNKGINGFLHQLMLKSVTLAQGQYQLKAQVQAQAPMALQATLEGRVKSVVPGGVAVTVLANAAVSGTLAGEQATLDAQAQARREDQSSSNALKANAHLPVLNATARILPWAVQPVHSAQLALAQLNLADFWPQAPTTSLSGTVRASLKSAKDAKDVKGQDWVADIALTNANPGPWDRQRLPVQSLKAQVSAVVDTQQQAQGARWTVSALQARAGDGELQGQGRWQDGTGAEPWQGKITFNRINPAALYSAMAQARLDGSADAVQQGAGTAFEVKLKSSAGRDAVPAALQGFSLGDAHAAGQWVGDSLRLSDLTLQAAQAKIQAKGELHIAARLFSGSLDAQFPGGSAGFKGLLKADALSFTPSDAKLNITLAQADVTWGWLKALPKVPQLLATVTPNLAQWAVKGQAEVALDWQGINRLVNARVSVPILVLQPPVNVPANELTSATTNATVSATGLRPEPLKFSALQLSAQGPLSALAVVADGVAEQAPYKIQLGSSAVLSLAASPKGGGGGQGAVDISRLSLQLQDSARSLAWALQSGSTNANDRALQLRWKDGSFEALPGQLRLVPQDLGGNTAPRLLPGDKAVTLAWDQMLWDTQGLRTQGRLSQLPLTWIDWLAGPKAQPLADLGLSGQLWFDGDWDVFWPSDVRTPVRLSAGLQRQRGTLSVLLDDGSVTASGQAGAKPVDVGLQEASLRVMTVPDASSGASAGSMPGTGLQARLRWNTDRAGVVDAEASTVLQASPGQSGWAWVNNAPVRGTVKAQLPQIGVWSLLAPPGWRMKGTLAAQATLGGTRAAPQWAGQVQADQLALRSVVDGIEFVNGQLRANLNGDNVVIERFTLEGTGGAKTGGQLTATGSAQWALDRTITLPAQPKRIPRIDLQVTLDKLRVSNRADRRLVVSGQAQAQLAGAQLKLRGKLRADQAAFTLTDELTPRLGDDVVVRGRKLAATSSEPDIKVAKVIPDVLLDLDLGESFAVEGSGLKARLQGTLQVISTPAQPLPRLLGEVRTTSGSYRAYGVNLNLETGLLRFAGPYDNPTLDILAIRPNITQRVGVQVTGTALVPVLRLYAEPELPDTEKLSWLVLGRSATGPGGDAAILQQAAMSLLGRPGSRMDGGIAGALGLDEVSYRSGGVNSDGSVTTAAVSVGKRLSSKLYVVYGQSLTSSVGTVSILYELSRRLTLRAKTGEDNALELVFTVRYD